ncbi:MAG: hypothetical protein ABIJ86_10825 [Spirochaetota bacterium]
MEIQDAVKAVKIWLVLHGYRFLADYVEADEVHVVKALHGEHREPCIRIDRGGRIGLSGENDSETEFDFTPELWVQENFAIVFEGYLRILTRAMDQAAA